MDGSLTFYLWSLSPLTPRRASGLAEDPDVRALGVLCDWTAGAPLLSGLTSRGQLVASQASATARETFAPSAQPFNKKKQQYNKCLGEGISDPGSAEMGIMLHVI